MTTNFRRNILKIILKFHIHETAYTENLKKIIKIEFKINLLLYVLELCAFGMMFLASSEVCALCFSLNTCQDFNVSVF